MQMAAHQHASLNAPTHTHHSAFITPNNFNLSVYTAFYVHENA